MKKIVTLFISAMFYMATIWSQSPQKISYQAVIRDASGKLISNQSIGIQVSILQASATGTEVYKEIQNPNPKTNANGLVSIEIGGGLVMTGTFANINWANGPYFIKTEIDPTGGTTYTIAGTSQLLSIPYAFYAKTAGNGFSGNYNDLTNKPSLADTSKYLKTEKELMFNASVAKGIKTSDTAKWDAKSNFSGSYTDLKNKPTLPDNTTFVTMTGNQTIAGNKTFAGTTSVATPVNATDAATKAYVDVLLAKINALESSLVASGFDARDIDGNLYHSVKIGTQVWMLENLKTIHYRNGDLIATTTTVDYTKEVNPKYQWAYNNDESYVDTYGRLYTWYAATDSRNLCPPGWHIPSETEWTVLENYLMVNGFNYDGSTSGNYYAKSLAATTNWASSSVVGSVGNTDYPAKRNVTGFTALPSGYRNPLLGFYYLGNNASWWASTESNPAGGWYRNMNYDGSFLVKNNFDNKNYGNAVRCIKD